MAGRTADYQVGSRIGKENPIHPGAIVRPQIVAQELTGVGIAVVKLGLCRRVVRQGAIAYHVAQAEVH
jgi:hypothetical protein